MPRKKNPAVAVLAYFRSQPKEVCDLTLALVKDLMAERFKLSPSRSTRGRTKPKTSSDPGQLTLPFDSPKES